MDVNAAAARIQAMLPDQQTVTLYTRAGNDEYLAGVSWSAQRVLPADLELQPADSAGLARERASWRLFLQGQSVTPEAGDKITDASSVTWQVEAVEARMGRNIFPCECVRDQ
jgi:hypothetical protein